VYSSFNKLASLGQVVFIIVLLSETPDGLQNALYKLNYFCLDMGLSVNLNKSKVMIFNKAGKGDKMHNFFIKTKLLRK
jgi:hypothetical protein